MGDFCDFFRFITQIAQIPRGFWIAQNPQNPRATNDKESYTVPSRVPVRTAKPTANVYTRIVGWHFQHVELVY